MENNFYDGKRKINWYIVNIDREINWYIVNIDIFIMLNE